MDNSTIRCRIYGLRIILQNDYNFEKMDHNLVRARNFQNKLLCHQFHPSNSMLFLLVFFLWVPDLHLQPCFHLQKFQHKQSQKNQSHDLHKQTHDYIAQSKCDIYWKMWRDIYLAKLFQVLSATTFFILSIHN
jgi:hypothetical protein